MSLSLTRWACATWLGSFESTFPRQRSSPECPQARLFMPGTGSLTGHRSPLAKLWTGRRLRDTGKSSYSHLVRELVDPDKGLR